MPPPNRPATALDEKTKAGFYWISVFLFAGALTLSIVECFSPAEASRPEAVLLCIALAGTVASLARQLPLAHAVFATLLVALAGGGVSILDIKTGIPFGAFLFSHEIGAKMFDLLPWIFPLLWPVAVLNSRGVARLVLRPWRKTKTYGFRLIGLSAVLTALFDLAFEPFASRVKHYWFWEPTALPLTWQGAPLVNFFSWAVVTVLILAFVTPFLINKNPRPKSAPDFFPLGIWLGAIVLFGTGCALQKIWPAVAADAVMGIITAIFAVRGAKW